jgi:hypothetical protein
MFNFKFLNGIIIMKKIISFFTSTLSYITPYVAATCVLVTVFSYGMNKEAQSAMETKYAHYLQQMGNEDVPAEVQSITQSVLFMFQQKNFLPQDSSILVKYMNQETVDSLQNKGAPTWNNLVTNGQNIIHITKQHDELTEEETKSRMGHELAHCAINQKAYLNPHYYMNKIAFGIGATFMVSPCWVPISMIFALSHKNPKRHACGIIMAGIGVYKAHSYLCENSKEQFHLPITSPRRITFSFLEKFEEVECDLIAAFTIPHGGRAGRTLYEKHLLHNGDTNGVDNDHPKTSTRVWYHKKIESIQNRKEKPETK